MIPHHEAKRLAEELRLYDGDIPSGYAAEIEVAIARLLSDALTEEREACARLCYKRMPDAGFEHAHSDPGTAYELGRIDQAQSDAGAIRARGQNDTQERVPTPDVVCQTRSQ